MSKKNVMPYVSEREYLDWLLDAQKLHLKLYHGTPAQYEEEAKRMGVDEGLRQLCLEHFEEIQGHAHDTDWPEENIRLVAEFLRDDVSGTMSPERLWAWQQRFWQAMEAGKEEREASLPEAKEIAASETGWRLLGHLLIGARVWPLLCQEPPQGEAFADFEAYRDECSLSPMSFLSASVIKSKCWYPYYRLLALELDKGSLKADKEDLSASLWKDRYDQNKAVLSQAGASQRADRALYFSGNLRTVLVNQKIMQSATKLNKQGGSSASNELTPIDNKYLHAFYAVLYGELPLKTKKEQIVSWLEAIPHLPQDELQSMQEFVENI